MNNRVFGIGLNKTGTSTLAECLRILGYNLCPENEGYAITQGNFVGALSLASEYNGFADYPWFSMYRVIDAGYPHSSFILTTRDIQTWYKSLRRWIDTGNIVLPNRQLDSIFDSLEWKPAINRFRQHNQQVVAHFSGRGNLLVVNWEDGDGWSQLCTFLNKPIPNVPFPHKLKYNPTTNDYDNR